MTNTNNQPIFFKILSVFTGLSFLITLSSLFEGIIKWYGIFANLISGYQERIYPVFDLLLGWLPFKIPNWIIDYLVLGILISGIAISLFIEIIWNDILEIMRDQPNYLWKYIKETTRFFSGIYFFLIIVWPLGILFILYQGKETEKFYENKPKDNEYLMAIRANKRAYTLLIIIVILIIMNYFIGK
tara:strand:- start:140405 stop:140962 length:558 start_codon:yes stop_codon:yes gene_type:complete